MSTRRLLLGGLSTTMIMASAVTLAAEADYNYLQTGYLKTRADLGGLEQTGFEAELSAPLEAGNFLRVRYARSKDRDDDATRTEFSGGLGMHTVSANNLDLYGLITYDEFKFRGIADDGYGGELGLRWLPSSSLELAGGGRYQKMGDRGESQTWFGGLVLVLGSGLAVSGRYENAEGESSISVGLRFLSR